MLLNRIVCRRTAVRRLVVFGLVQPCPSLPELSECGSRYLKSWDKFWDATGAWLHSHGRGEDPTDSWRDNLKEAHLQDDMKKELQALRDAGEHEPALLFGHASSMILICWGRDGRFWHATMKRSSDLAALGSVTLCAPDICNEEELEAEIVPLFYDKVMRSSDTDFLAAVKVKELSHWADVGLDFVVVGVDGCGTTAVRRGLARHTSVNFTSFSVFSEDEDFFLHEMGRQTLPYMSQVRAFMSKRDAMSQRRHPGLIGLYQATIWKEQMLLQVLSQIPLAKVVVTVCDPVDRFERLVNLHMKSHGGDIQEAIAALQQSADPFSEWKHLLRWKSQFGDRILFVERDLLSSWETFYAMTDFLGLRPISARSSLMRYNSRGRRDVNFCANGTLLAELKQRFEDSYQVIELCLNGLLSERLRNRTTRCEIKSELVIREECLKRRCAY